MGPWDDRLKGWGRRFRCCRDLLLSPSGTVGL